MSTPQDSRARRRERKRRAKKNAQWEMKRAEEHATGQARVPFPLE